MKIFWLLFVSAGGALLALGWLFTAPATPAAEPPNYPPGPLGALIRLGKELVETTSTHELTRPFAGNALHCTSCHLKAGTHDKASPFVGAATAYPAFSPREKRVISLEERIMFCFERSLNGKAPPHGHRVNLALAAYITWLSQGQPLRMNAQAPLGPKATPYTPVEPAQADRGRGRRLYEAKCASCHGEDGQGDEDSPPVWGAKSYNTGAGLARVDKLASWLKVAMPLRRPNLTIQEALDIAAYVNSHDRPAFRGSAVK